MFTEVMLESIKKVEATRAARMSTEPRRMTAEEKDELKTIASDACEEILAGEGNPKMVRIHNGRYCSVGTKGMSGDFFRARAQIEKLIAPLADKTYTDALGNLIAVKYGNVTGYANEAFVVVN